MTVRPISTSSWIRSSPGRTSRMPGTTKARTICIPSIETHGPPRATRPTSRASIPGRPRYLTTVSVAWRQVRSRGRWSRAGSTARRQHYDPLILDMYKKMGGPSLHLRQIARMHETIKLYRQAEHCLREFRLKDPWYVKPTERDGRGWGATEATRGALCHWIEVQGGKIKNYRIIAPTTWNVGPRDGQGSRGPIEEALMGAPIADATDPVEVGHVARSFDSCLA